MQNQQKQLETQLVQLQILLDSYQQGKNLFKEKDAYGYEQTYIDFTNQIETLSKTIQQQNANIQAQNAASHQTQKAIQSAIRNIQEELSDYRQAKKALQNNAGLNQQNAAYTLYQSYQQQKDQEGADTLKQQVLSQIDSQIANLENSLSGYEIQYGHCLPDVPGERGLQPWKDQQGAAYDLYRASLSLCSPSLRGDLGIHGRRGIPVPASMAQVR